MAGPRPMSQPTAHSDIPSRATYALLIPSTVADVFAAAGLVPEGAVRWGEPVPQPATGIYVVALVDEPTSASGVLPAVPLSEERLCELLSVRPELRLDGAEPTVDQLATRLGAFWLSDEVVLYIGLAGQPVRTRVRQYYTTPLGAKRPHAGGWWLKTLSVLEELWVHYTATPGYQTAETDMLKAFANAVSPEARAALHDPLHVAPFANLRTGTGAIKGHGITGATGVLAAGQRAARPARSPTPRPRQTSSGAATPPRRPASRGGGRERSQRVTARDHAAGQIRFPRAAKRLFPAVRGQVDVVIRGRELRARWDSRVGPDRERSGVLAFGRGELDGLVGVSESLAVHIDDAGRPALE